MEELKSYGDIAVIIPCYNEEKTITTVIQDFQKFLPGARIFVFDNCSSDQTSALAKASGATVVFSPRRGKGNVVRHMFREVEADLYLMVDGDCTYPADQAVSLIQKLRHSGADMVVGTRLRSFQKHSFRRFHQFGNKLITGTIRSLFDVSIVDVLSGYRVFTREFVKTIPLTSEGFEIETELTLQSVAKGFVILETPIEYGERPAGSFSKLNTYSDGWLIIKSIFHILKDYKPLLFFSLITGVFCFFGIWVGFAPVQDFFTTGMVTHLPRAVLASGLMILAALSMSIGLVLETAVKYHHENFGLWRRLLKNKA